MNEIIFYCVWQPQYFKTKRAVLEADISQLIIFYLIH